MSPDWVKVFAVDYELGTPVKVAVQIFDEVRKGDNKSMGSAVFDVGSVSQITNSRRRSFNFLSSSNVTILTFSCQFFYHVDSIAPWG